MAHSRPSKRHGRQRHDRSALSRDNPSSRHARQLNDGQDNDASANSAGTHPVPALLSQPAANAEGQSTSTALVVVPERLPAIPTPPQTGNAAASTRRGTGTFGKALLMSGGLAAALIFTLGSLKKTPEAPQAAMAAPVAVVSATAPESVAPAPATALEAAKPKPAHPAKASAAPVEKKARQAQPARTAARAADKKKEAQPTLAKAPRKTTEAAYDAPQPPTLLASKSTDGYAQCLAIANFLRREQCKWQVCNGKWGQDGCPSYAPSRGEVY